MKFYKKSDLPMQFACPSSYIVDDEVSELPSELQHGRGTRMGFFDVPTEFVVSSTRICAPRQGRYWEVDLHLYCGMYVPYDTFRGRPLYADNPYTTRAVVVERWEDYGDDGHTNYRLVGYALVTSEDEALTYNEWTKYPRFK